jgi:uncharacterized membrane protein
MAAKHYFSKDQESLLLEAIRAAEQNTSGEIRLHVESRCKLKDPRDRAAQVFEGLGMQKTALRNGVLFYISLDDHQFAILGDAGIDAHVPPGFWDNIKELMLGFFQKGEIVSGLIAGIAQAGLQLGKHFPYHAASDQNELSDDISYHH